jgi:hypothetical protein
MNFYPMVHLYIYMTLGKFSKGNPPDHLTSSSFDKFRIRLCDDDGARATGRMSDRRKLKKT